MVFTIDDTDDIDKVPFFKTAYIDVDVFYVDFYMRVCVGLFLDENSNSVACLIDLNDFGEKGNFGIVIKFCVFEEVLIFFYLNIIMFVFSVAINHE